MNIIDKNFKDILDIINNSSIEDIFIHIKQKYLEVSKETRKSIEKFLNSFKYWGDLDFENDIYEELHNRAINLKEHINDISWLYYQLNDYRSKRVLFGILNYWYNNDFKALDLAYEKNYNQYFDLDILKCNKDEVFVDVGAYTGDTIQSYIDNYGQYKKIYAYEITTKNIEIMKNYLKNYSNIIYKDNAISNSHSIYYLYNNEISSSANKIEKNGNIKVYSTTLDSDIEEKITLIKMDIEGSEEKALLGSINHIKNDTPKLLISVYHNHHDIWKIPLLIYSINSNYNFYLRCYGNKYYPTEIVFMAIPK